MRLKRTILLLLNLLFAGFCFAQADSSNIFLKDLDFVYSNLKNTTSYKTQKATHKHVEAKYSALKASLSNKDLPTIERFIKLYELVDHVKDLHNDISGNTEIFAYEDLLKPEFLEKLKKDPDYNIFPRSKLDLDSLDLALSNRRIDAHEGIYYYQNYFKIAIVRNANRLEGIVLDTKIPSWERGETILF